MIIKHLNKISLKNAGFSSLELIVVMALLITLATIGNQKYAAYKRHTNMSEVDIALIYFGKMSSTYLIDHNEFIKKDNEEFISASLSVNSKDNCVKDNPFNITTFPRCEEFPYDIK